MSAAVRTIEAKSSAYGLDTVAGDRTIPVEMPIAIEINGIAYAVMMATPTDLEDFVTGFIVCEGLASAEEIDAVQLHPVADGEGMVARVNLPAHCLGPILERARRRLGDSSCGICGIESVEAALRPLPAVSRRCPVHPAAIRKALGGMRAQQELGWLTSATHAAAFANPDGEVLILREDVGRHNALDKVIGALARAGSDASGGFLLVTSRCSYELVEKAVRAGCSLLVAISAPTDLAVRRAKSAGLALAVVARDDGMIWVAGPAMENSDAL